MSRDDNDADENAEQEFLDAAETLARTALKKRSVDMTESVEQSIKSRAAKLLKDFKEIE